MKIQIFQKKKKKTNLFYNITININKAVTEKKKKLKYMKATKSVI